MSLKYGSWHAPSSQNIKCASIIFTSRNDGLLDCQIFKLCIKFESKIVLFTASGDKEVNKEILSEMVVLILKPFLRQQEDVLEKSYHGLDQGSPNVLGGGPHHL